MGARARVAAVCLCLALLLSACGAFGSQNINELLRAPALGYGQDEIQQALAAYLDGAVPQYRYPKEGDWRRPLIQGDLDGNGTNEAVLLYTLDDSTLIGREKGNYVYVAVLEQLEGTWQVIWDEQGLSTDVASLELADLLGNGTRQLIVGYATSNLNARTFALYTYDNKVLQRQYSTNYSRYEIGDFTGRGGSDLVLVSPNDEPGNLLLRYLPVVNGRFALDALPEPVRLDVNFIACAGLTPSVGAGGERLVVVDGETEGGALASQLVYYSDDRFYTIDDAGTMRGETARLNPLLTTRDIDGDGVAEIPKRVGGSEIHTPAADKKLEYAEWVDYTSSLEPIVKQYGLLDSDRSAFIRLPDEWRGKVTVADGTEKGEWVLQDRRTMATLLSLKLVEPGDAPPLSSQRVPGNTDSYIVFHSGITAEQREVITMTSLV